MIPLHPPPPPTATSGSGPRLKIGYNICFRRSSPAQLSSTCPWTRVASHTWGLSPGPGDSGDGRERAQAQEIVAGSEHRLRRQLQRASSGSGGRGDGRERSHAQETVERPRFRSQVAGLCSRDRERAQRQEAGSGHSVRRQGAGTASGGRERSHAQETVTTARSGHRLKRQLQR